MSTFEVTSQNRVVRVPNRGAYDKEMIYQIIDDAMICHVGLIQDGKPVVIPTLHARDGDNVLLHGATTSRLLKYAQSGQDICVTITLVDGLVLARSVMHHSMNYRSVVVFGKGYLVSDPDEKLAAMKAFTERLIPGRWADARQPNEKEMKATSIVAIPMTSASAKVRTGGPVDDEEDYSLPIWAGVLPMKENMIDPIDDDRLIEGVGVPEYVSKYIQAKNK